MLKLKYYEKLHAKLTKALRDSDTFNILGGATVDVDPSFGNVNEVLVRVGNVVSHSQLNQVAGIIQDALVAYGIDDWVYSTSESTIEYKISEVNFDQALKGQKNVGFTDIERANLSSVCSVMIAADEILQQNINNKKIQKLQRKVRRILDTIQDWDINV